MTTQAFVREPLRTPFVRYARCTVGVGVGPGIALMPARV
jgi:hypothetical protein